MVSTSRSLCVCLTPHACSAQAPVHQLYNFHLAASFSVYIIFQDVWNEKNVRKIICFHRLCGIECCELMALYCTVGHCINTLNQVIIRDALRKIEKKSDV